MKTKILLLSISIAFFQVGCSRQSAPDAAEKNQREKRSGKIKEDVSIIEETPPPPIEHPDPAMIRIDTAQLKSQIETLTEFINENLEDAKAYSARGDLRKIIGDMAGACEDWKKAQELGAEFMEGTIERNCK